MDTLLTIAVPTFHNPTQLVWCLRSLLTYTDFPYHVVVVNNFVGDNDWVDTLVNNTEHGGRVSVLNMGYNAGWMGAVNAALAQTKTPYFAMLNDDVVFIPGLRSFWLDLVNTLQNPKVGIVGPVSNFIAGAQNVIQMDVPPIAETTLLIGMCLVMRTQEFKDVGGLDVTLPGGDDLDLSIRYRKTGKGLVIIRSAYLHHFGQQTGKRVHGDDWDSVQHREATDNALIRKHGVRLWHETFMAAWAAPPIVPGLATVDETWLPQKLEKYKGCVGLDLGCGGNRRVYPDIKLIGIDRDGPEVTGVGGRRFKGATPDIVSDVTNLPMVESNSVDFAIASHVVEHLLNPLDALREWLRVVKPLGELFIAVPDQEKVPGILLDCSHLHGFSARFLRQIVELAGWFVLECESMDWGVLGLRARKPGEDA